jgi:hypothetical protein
MKRRRRVFLVLAALMKGRHPNPFALGSGCRRIVAGLTRETALKLTYPTILRLRAPRKFLILWRSLRDSNPCYSLEIYFVSSGASGYSLHIAITR